MYSRPAVLPAVALAMALIGAPAAAERDPDAVDCPVAGQWHAPGEGNVDAVGLFDRLADAPAVLLGELHDRMDHHRWQLHVLAGLHSRRPDMVIGLEMLPRAAQPALDAWVAGDLNRDDFLRASNWQAAWGHDIELYLPILHFARMHRVPLRALNVERSLASRLAEDGWDAVPPDERGGITPPASPPEAYRQRLQQVFDAHPTADVEDRDGERFVRAQLVWDRAMAAAIADAAADGTLVVALIGRGHLEYGHGVPHQLADLGVRASRVLLPWDPADCARPEAHIADAVFPISQQESRQPPMRLGVLLDDDDDGSVSVRGVQPGSAASRAGLRAGDRFVTAAGRPVNDSVDLVSTVRRQAPGTWLPLEISREGARQELFVHFPPAAADAD